LAKNLEEKLPDQISEIFKYDSNKTPVYLKAGIFIIFARLENLYGLMHPEIII
jgi:hypothetical protein